MVLTSLKPLKDFNYGRNIHYFFLIKFIIMSIFIILFHQRPILQLSNDSHPNLRV